jgi:hypothetical protein
MKRDYWTCPLCKSNNDFGEPCDCNQDIEEETSNENATEKDTHPELQRV